MSDIEPVQVLDAAPPRLRLQSTGAGVQSTAMALLIAAGEIPPIDGAIFADTGWEPRAVYDHLERMEREIYRPAGIPLYRVSNGSIRSDALDPEHRFASMPMFVRNPDVTVPKFVAPCPAGCDWSVWLEHQAAYDDGETDEPAGDEPADCGSCHNNGGIYEDQVVPGGGGMVRRQCTSEYKLKPIKRKVRELLGYQHPTPVPRGVFVEQLVGISTDEVHRAKDSGIRYSRNTFPLLDLGLSRRDCLRVLHAAGWETTPKSACIGCPFHGNAQWRRMRDEQPDEFADAVDFDRSIRGGSARANATGKNLRGSMFLHRSMVPLDEAPIDHVTRAEHAAGQLSITDLLGDIEAGVDIEAYDFEQGCGPWSCRSDGA